MHSADPILSKMKHIVVRKTSQQIETSQNFNGGADNTKVRQNPSVSHMHGLFVFQIHGPGQNSFSKEAEPQLENRKPGEPVSLPVHDAIWSVEKFIGAFLLQLPVVTTVNQAILYKKSCF